MADDHDPRPTTWLQRHRVLVGVGGALVVLSAALVLSRVAWGW